MRGVYLFVILLNKINEIEKRVQQFLGGEDPLWGTHFPFGLETFMDPEKIASVRKSAAISKNN